MQTILTSIYTIRTTLHQLPMGSVFIILMGAVICGYIAKALKQPQMVGYMMMGVIVGLTHAFGDTTMITTIGSLGVGLLLFTAGMELNPNLIHELSYRPFVVGSLQVLITFVVASGALYIVGYDIYTILFVAGAVSLSSTIVVVKLLQDQGDLSALYGKHALGVMTTQDILSLLLLVALCSMLHISQAGMLVSSIGMGLVYTIVCVILLYIVGTYILERVLKYIVVSSESLVVTMLVWGSMWGYIFTMLGVGMEAGFLIAGMSIAQTIYRYDIAAKLAPIRDVMLVLFFVGLGMHIGVDGLMSHITIVCVLLGCVIVVKPLITASLYITMDMTPTNSIKLGILVGSLSEFSYILMQYGVTTGHITDPALPSIVMLVGLMSIIWTGYMSTHSGLIISFCMPYIRRWTRSNNKALFQTLSASPHDVVIFGYGRMGRHVYEGLSTTYRHILVVDHDPSVIKQLGRDGREAIYADMGDTELYASILDGSNAVVVSTIPDVSVSTMLIQYIKRVHPHLRVCVTADMHEHAMMLYEAGADYVLLPHIVAADHIQGVVTRLSQGESISSILGQTR